MAGETHGMPSEQEASAHGVPARILITVWLILVVLTVITVSAANLELGNLSLFTAMAIATVKAAFVLLYFMHLRYDRPFNSVILIGSLFFLALFISLALMDTQQYQSDVIPGPAPGLTAP